MNEVSNIVLKKITRHIYEERMPLPEYQKTNIRIERVNNRNFAELWFLTAGCRHDRQGGCTMCNYGKGRTCWEDEILREIEKTIAQMPEEYEEFIISPIGSMLDEREVSDHMMRGLKDALQNIHSETLITETRADTVTKERLMMLKNIFDARYRCVEIGVESSSDWILRNCVNKGCTVEDYKRAIAAIKEAGMIAIVNIGIGIPFMSERMAVEHAIESVCRADMWGADSIVLFPYHVKPGTLAGVLYELGEYQPVSLWSLVEVLDSLELRIQSKTRISWYKNYYKEPDKIISSPGTCPACYEEVLSLLEEYKNLMKPETIRSLVQMECSCKIRWRERLRDEALQIDLERMEKNYRTLSERYGVSPRLLERELEFMRDTYR
ncbi:radical SAM protein [Bariatricus sp. SGI.154]|uniref:radical SAM protein n=1 Tax=Bariatricus sp. SGI.154 TaxID=3420549 RepID=UPI003D04F106